MKTIDLYNQAKFHTTLTKEARQPISWWRRKKNKPCIAMDTETTGLYFGLPTYHCISIPVDNSERKAYEYIATLIHDVKVFGISAAIEFNGVVNLYWGRFGSPLYTLLVKLMGTEGPKCFHNARYDLKACKASDIYLAEKIHCTYTMSRIYWDRRKAHKLEKLAEFVCPELCCWEHELGDTYKALRRMFKKEGYDDNYVNYSFIDDEVISKYAMIDAFLCLMLWQQMNGEAKWV